MKNKYIEPLKIETILLFNRKSQILIVPSSDPVYTIEDNWLSLEPNLKKYIIR